MSQLNFYVPDEIEKKIKAAAKKRKMSVSSFIAELVKQKMSEKPKKITHKSLMDLGGMWDGDFEEMERKPPQTRGKL